MFLTQHVKAEAKNSEMAVLQGSEWSEVDVTELSAAQTEV